MDVKQTAQRETISPKRPTSPEADWLPRAYSPPLRTVAASLIRSPVERRRLQHSEAQFGEAGLRDYRFTDQFHLGRPDRVFDELRWGGQFVFVSRQAGEVRELVEFYRGKPEWAIEVADGHLLTPRFAAVGRPRLPGPLGRMLERPSHFAVIRKILLDPVSRLTARHSYDVQLAPASTEVESRHAADGYVVLKRVPSLPQAVERLRQTCPALPVERLHDIGQKLVDKVFPVFLTREAAFLKLLQRDLPEALRERFPRVLSMQTDDHGLVRSMTLQWLRQGGKPIRQKDFVRQSARLLRALHHHVGIMHLDLRLDNMLVTPSGVSLVDFGSAVRVGEKLQSNPMLDRLLREMLSASQITRDLKRQRKKGLIRSEAFRHLPYPPDPAFDLFALATNMTRPHDNPDLKGLIKYDRESDEGRFFSMLRRRILQGSSSKPPLHNILDLCEELKVRPESDRAAEPVVVAPPMMPRRGRPRIPLQPDAEAG